MRTIVITVPGHARRAADGDLEVLVRDHGDEGHDVLTADVRPMPDGIWTPATVREEYS